MALTIDLKDFATDGKVNIPKGKYVASMNSFTGEVMLVGGGKDYKCQATRRQAKIKNERQKSTSMSFYAAGAQQWSLIISDPKSGEWILMLELGKEAKIMDPKQKAEAEKAKAG